VRWLGRLGASVALVAAVTGAVALLERHVPVLSLLVLFLLAVLPVAVLWGARLAALTAVMSVAVFAFLFVEPRGSLSVADSRNIVELTVFLVTAVGVSELAARLRRAAVESRRLTKEQSALRRVATLVAQSVPPSGVFEAVTREVGLLSGADLARMERYESDGSVTGVGAWSRVPVQLAVGTRLELDGLSVARDVRRSGGPVRLESFAGATGAIAGEARALGIRSSVGCPIVVRGRLWGVIAASTKRENPFPANTESQIARFTELVAAAIENAEARAELRRVADQQAALRRVATLVARGAAPEPVFAAVANEVTELIESEYAVVFRWDPDGMATLLAVGGPLADPGTIGVRWKPEQPSATASVLATGKSARYDGEGVAPEDQPEFLRDWGVRSSIAVPITVEGRSWGAISVFSRSDPFPPDTEPRMAEFTELVATAIASAEARDELRRIADEQAALRRVATLVAHGLAPDLVFAAVAKEVGALFDADLTAIVRFEPDGDTTLIAGVGLMQGAGARAKTDPGDALATVRNTGRAARFEANVATSASLPKSVRGEPIRSVVAAPIVVQAELWGAIATGSQHQRVPLDTERRMADFTELVATAIANAEAQTALTASRARVVATADETRRRIERDLHDGAQQRLVSLALQLRLAQNTVPVALPELRAGIGQVAEDLTAVLEELREISRGLHPAILSQGGLGPALRTLARRSAVPVELKIETRSRYPSPTEVAAYYVVTEALTNTAKHANAAHAQVQVREQNRALRLSVSDDGVGGAHLRQGSGLLGLRDRVEALGGSVDITSPVGHGTVIHVSLPIDRTDSGTPPEPLPRTH